MNLIPTPERTPAESCADQLVAQLNAQLQSRLHTHRQLHDFFWRSESAMPEDILAALGRHAGRFVACAEESLRHLRELATIAGAEFSDLLPESAWQPQRPIVVHDDGSASLAPAPAD